MSEDSPGWRETSHSRPVSAGASEVEGLDLERDRSRQLPPEPCEHSEALCLSSVANSSAEFFVHGDVTGGATRVTDACPSCDPHESITSQGDLGVRAVGSLLLPPDPRETPSRRRRAEGVSCGEEEVARMERESAISSLSSVQRDSRATLFLGPWEPVTEGRASAGPSDVSLEELSPSIVQPRETPTAACASLSSHSFLVLNRPRSGEAENTAVGGINDVDTLSHTITNSSASNPPASPFPEKTEPAAIPQQRTARQGSVMRKLLTEVSKLYGEEGQTSDATEDAAEPAPPVWLPGVPGLLRSVGATRAEANASSQATAGQAEGSVGAGHKRLSPDCLAERKLLAGIRAIRKHRDACERVLDEYASVHRSVHRATGPMVHRVTRSSLAGAVGVASVPTGDREPGNTPRRKGRKTHALASSAPAHRVQSCALEEPEGLEGTLHVLPLTSSVRMDDLTPEIVGKHKRGTPEPLRPIMGPAELRIPGGKIASGDQPLPLSPHPPRPEDVLIALPAIGQENTSQCLELGHKLAQGREPAPADSHTAGDSHHASVTKASARAAGRASHVFSYLARASPPRPDVLSLPPPPAGPRPEAKLVFRPLNIPDVCRPCSPRGPAT